jgi:hypothetical protein
VPDFAFDLGGLTGGVLGALAAGFGVVYLLRKTEAQNRRERDGKIARLRAAIAVVHQAFMFQCGQVGLLLEQMSPDELLPLTPPRKLTELLREISAWPRWWTIRYPGDAPTAPT